MVSTQPHSGVPARKSVAGISPVVLVNAAEVLLAEFGPDALTFRDLSIATGYSGDGIRQTCGSRAALIGRTWARAAGRFLALLTSLVDETHGDAWEKACAAAEASLLFPGSIRGRRRCWKPWAQETSCDDHCRPRPRANCGNWSGISLR